MNAPKVVILCGGKGTRSYPFTEYLPKAMMPIGGTPIVVHLMRLYAAQGFTEFVLAAGHRREVLLDYFDGRYKDWEITVLDTGETSDTGERLRRCADYVGDTFFGAYGDGLGDVDLEALQGFHRACGGLATVTAVQVQLQYGAIEFGEGFRVERFSEKPVLRDYWVNAGFFVFEKGIFDGWPGPSLERDVLPALAARGKLYTYLHRGFWRSMDTSKDQQELEAFQNNGTAPWLHPRQKDRLSASTGRRQ